MKRLLGILLISLFLSVACTVQTEQKPKNIVLFISDGCGFNQVDAASLYQFGETGKQVYEQFPVKLAMSTYSLSGIGYNPDSIWSDFDYPRKKPTDSAASATAISTGIKTFDGRIGIDTTGQALLTAVEHFEALGKATGVITSVQFSHATPAGFVAHNISRRNYGEIAREMILESQLDVIMGCGHPLYDNDGAPLENPDYRMIGSDSLWQALIAGSAGNDANGDGEFDPWLLIQERSQFQEFMQGETPPRVIGIAKAKSTLQQERSGDPKALPFELPFNPEVPTLQEMTLAAINILSKNANGFFLMVEGGAVDWAGHSNQSGRLIEEQMSFNRAVESAVEWVNQNSNWNETIIIVTADHETGYLTGPNSGNIKNEQGDIEAVWKPLVNNGKNNLPGMQWNSGGHTNQLVPFYAKGVLAERFRDYIIQSDPVYGNYIDNSHIGQFLLSIGKKD